jgi:glucan phosphorylase
MSEDMPWVIGLTDEEVQELRKNKQELTEYGKEKIRELMNEEVQLTEKENQVLDIARNIMEEHKDAFQHLAAIERKEFAETDFKDLTREQKIQLALEEIDWIVIGGQDGEEFYGSIQFLRKVLRSLV